MKTNLEDRVLSWLSTYGVLWPIRGVLHVMETVEDVRVYIRGYISEKISYIRVCLLRDQYASSLELARQFGLDNSGVFSVDWRSYVDVCPLCNTTSLRSGETHCTVCRAVIFGDPVPGDVSDEHISMLMTRVREIIGSSANCGFCDCGPEFDLDVYVDGEDDNYIVIEDPPIYMSDYIGGDDDSS